MDERLQQLWLLAQLGPLRFAHSSTKPVQLVARAPARLAHNGGHGGPTLIRVQGHPSFAVGEIRVGGDKGLGVQSSVTVDLTAGTFEELLLPSEELFARADVNTTLIVTEVVLP